MAVSGPQTARQPQGLELVRLQRAALGHAAEAERRLPDLVEEIRSLLLEADPLLLYSRVTLLLQLRRVAPEPLSFGADAMTEFLGGLITAMPVEQIISRLGAEYAPDALWALDRLLREYGIAHRRIGDGKLVREGPGGQLDDVRHLLEFENQFERMLGYPAQLRPIFTSITGPLADQSRAVLGYAPGDALTVADAYHKLLSERQLEVEEQLQPFQEQLSPTADQATAIQHYAGYMTSLATFGAATAEDLATTLAAHVGIPSGQLALLLDAMTTELGSQPTFNNLRDTNTLRRRPVLGLPDGRRVWASPGDFIHIALDWAADAYAHDTNLLKAFDKRRQDACEELAHQALATVFGDEHVHRGATYPANGQRPDIDILVATPGASIVVEAKAGRFTDPARRGAPERVKKKSREFVDKALDQNARTIRHLRGGAPDLQDGNKHRLTIPNSPHLASVIVTLDRVDPFATHLPDGGKRGDVPTDGTWLVSLADLFMVADVLRHPAEFYAYVELRARINNLGGPVIYAEADALGVWCEKRITAHRPRAGEPASLGVPSQTINHYYTREPVRLGQQPPTRPKSAVPPEVLTALDDVMRQRPSDWHFLTVEALSLPPSRWSPVVKAINSTTASRRSRKDRKRVGRATIGIRLTDNLAISVAGDSAASNEPTIQPASVRIIATKDS